MSQTTATSTRKRLIVDPVTRIEGHLKIEVELDNDHVKNAWVSTQLFRGIETILKGRPPEDAPLFTQRTCGVCTNTHALTSIRAIEDALDLTVPPLAQLMRHLILSALIVHDHLVHYYHLHGLDWIDMAAATKADPAKAGRLVGQTSKRGDNPAELYIMQKRLKDFVASGQLGFLENAYFLGGNTAYRFTPEENLIMTYHYFEGLRVQLKLARAMALFAGKNPHAQSMVVGGMSCYDSLRPEVIGHFREIWEEVLEFAENAMMPDILLMTQRYPEALGYGKTSNFMAFSDFHDPSSGQDPYFKSGVLWGNDLGKHDKMDINNIAEHVSRSWYKGDEALKPYDGKTEPNYTSYEDKEKYSWSKAPRYKTEPMETGPLARRALAYAKGEKETKTMLDDFFSAANMKPDQLFSTMGRTISRVVETTMLTRRMKGWIDETEERIKSGDDSIYKKYTMPDTARGVGLCCVTRGALSHWISIKDSKIENIQLVVPSTWNLGPRCAEGKLSPAEQSLIGCPCPDPDRPVEILRTIHSFDPCIACSVHLVDNRDGSSRKFKVL
ncbi:nickel-dependent hydrogenase large subunit [Pseudodesulfovibrio piezophilus]|uniref:Periplasmic [NiFe] hydrogenase large subunit n=1 Tax=Pseudodesulfovibrio piezophilus (strain DSM 21447 / JCM 15486 / C1TLV30) TaxID=1322246 RepID=M1WKA7_PSEP2|nr:nickel-dependent hydrogenase large subunit [Pseudodesulfovibrio piezophilus]CCH49271.1 Periplasmic [NiFe] hydrogenase large subunit [Pseudodesulfovibrio piezophilus C1TLV30]